jgi:serine/threonine protein kinase
MPDPTRTLTDTHATASVGEHTTTDRATAGTPADPGEIAAPPGFALLAEVGRGGMGVVFRAKDLELDREVAVKLLLPKYGVGSTTARRFVGEARITAQLQHPGIPPVYRVGELPDGRPFLAMKLIKGQTLDVLLKADPGSAGASPSQSSRWLGTFEAVCQAVGYAHAHGVIHRDLKPANVMVGAFGEVQVMDWGLAKVLDWNRDRPGAGGPDPDPDATATPCTEVKSLRDTDLLTQHGSILGTPAFMAPEQAIGAVDQIDRQTDVFGLGAILCSLLTGKPPYVSESAESTRQLAARAKLDDAFARLQSCGAEPDLIALCKRCLSAEKPDRPADASELAAAVAALRAAADDRARKAEIDREKATVKAAEQTKRRRVVQWAGGVTAAVLLAGVIGTAVGLVQARAAESREKDRANGEAEARRKEQVAKDAAVTAADLERLAKEKAVKAAAAEKTARDEEERQRKFAQAITAFVIDDFLALTSVEGQDRFDGFGLDRHATLQQLLDRAAGKLKARADLDPRTEAELCWIVGVNYRGAGEAAKGLPFLERAVALRRRELGDDHADTLDAMNSLAVCYRAVGKWDRALALHEETLRLATAKFGADHKFTLLAALGVAKSHQAAGRPGHAIPLLRESLTRHTAVLGAEHADTTAARYALARAYLEDGKLDLAVPLHEQVFRRNRADLGADHEHTLRVMDGLANAYHTAGRLDLALPMYEEAFRLTKAKLGADHPMTLTCMGNLADGYREVKNLALALPLSEEVFRLCKTKLGVDHPDTLTCMNNLAACYGDAGKLDLALPLLEEAFRLTKAKQGADHPDTLVSMGNLAAGYHAARRMELALPLYAETLRLRRAKLGSDHPDTLTSVLTLADGHRTAGQLDRALPLYEEAARGVEKRQFEYQYARRIAQHTVRGYEEAERFEAAATWRQKWLGHVKAQTGADHPAYAGELATFGKNLLEHRRWAEAEPLLRECLKIREKKEPDAWSTFHTRSMLGGALAGQKKYADAEPLLVQGYEGMKARDKALPPQGVTRLPEALDRLIALYTATDKPDEAAKYRELRAKYREQLPPPRKG